MIEKDKVFELEFSFTQSEVDTFAEITGDKNPVHLDDTYAAGTVYKKPIIHGFLGGAIFSRIFGNLFPGEGTVYLSQSLQFKRPMYAGVAYKAVLTVLEVEEDKHKARIETKIVEAATNKLNLTGEASILNKTKIGANTA